LGSKLSQKLLVINSRSLGFIGVKTISQNPCCGGHCPPDRTTKYQAKI